MYANFFLILLPLLVFFSACSTKNYKYTLIDNNISNVNEYKELVTRSRNYWEAFSKNDFTTTYEYELPYLNFKHDLQWYKSFHNGSKNKFKIILLKIVKIDDDIVQLSLQYKKRDNKYIFTDKWISVNGEWYHKYSDSLIPDLED